MYQKFNHNSLLLERSVYNEESPFTHRTKTLKHTKGEKGEK